MATAKPRTGKRSFTDLLAHIHPATVPDETLRFTLSWGLGGMCATLVLLLFVTGIFQLLVYDPSAVGAYGSVRGMYSGPGLAGWIRNIHHWSANLLVIVVVLHLLRVLLTGAISTERRLNWIVGLVLLSLVLASNFSGYLLPWDQLGYWAVTICTSMMGYVPGIGSWLLELFRGGDEVGAATLANFYGLHVAVIPCSFILLMVWHFWLVRKSGGLIQGKREGDEPIARVPSVPDLIVREAAVGLGLVAFILLAAVYFDAPLQEHANPGLSPNPAKAPWYFLGFQELLLHLHPVFAICVVPMLALVVLLLLPFWPGAVLPPGIWFGGERGGLLALWSFAAGILVTILFILLDEKMLRSVQEAGAGENDIFTRGFLPVVLFIIALAVVHQVLVRRYKKSRAEAVLVGMSICCAVLCALTLTGLFFRGPGMQLIWFRYPL